jgi:hypothetical protein
MDTRASHGGVILLRLALLLVCLLGCISASRADGRSSLPFSEHELEQALSARLAAPLRARLTITTVDHRLLIRLGAALRMVELGGSQGAEAARIVAVIAASMASETPTLSPPASQAPEPSETRDSVRVEVDFAAQRGLAREESFSFDLGLGASVRLRERLILAARAGYWKVPSVHSTATGTVVRFDALSLRPAIGVRFAPIELLAGAVVAPFWVSGGAGHGDQLYGVSAQCSLWLRVVSSLRIVARLTCDAFVNRSRLFGGADRVLTTPRVMLGLALGFAWGVR